MTASVAVLVHSMVASQPPGLEDVTPVITEAEVEADSFHTFRIRIALHSRLGLSLGLCDWVWLSINHIDGLVPVGLSVPVSIHTHFNSLPVHSQSPSSDNRSVLFLLAILSVDYNKHGLASELNSSFAPFADDCRPTSSESPVAEDHLQKRKSITDDDLQV
ncbi:hypothetical protein CONLIGDRAFT_649992 [Coniochaeta ligniaria NRRL 30616]|uniref:Uncharacterized protein n=1 Tax=Coniochaeta ligniaria NRRL 30616 TaxID=1408157 RepID=A0A1J7J211_9PEZI|nr:hypothetical protein CONLIGDRAFT_649992 [Coniochaeta ligniaria NRRL 30616]